MSESAELQVVGEEDVVVAVRVGAERPALPRTPFENPGRNMSVDEDPDGGGSRCAASPESKRLPGAAAPSEPVLHHVDQAVELPISGIVVQGVEAPRDRC